MALQSTDLFIVQRNQQSYKMEASLLEALIGGGVKPSPDEPTDKQPGDLWYDTDTNILYYWNGSVWVPITPETPDAGEPTDPVPGQLWYDTSVQALKCYVGGDWVWSIKGAESGPTDPDPASGLEGQLFYNTTTDDLKVYKDGAWAVAGGGASVDVGTTAPSNATEGNLWWNSEEGVLYIYYGPDASGTEQWVQAAGSTGTGGGANVSISPTKPDSAVEGDLWFNSDNGRLFIYYTGDVWVDASPAGQFNGGVVENSITTPEKAITTEFDISTGCFWTCGSIDVPNPTNAVSGMTGTIRFTGTPTSWGSSFKFTDGVPVSPTAPAIVAFYVQDTTNILIGNVLNNYA